MGLGGYQILDLKHKPFHTDSAQGASAYYYEGIYDLVEGTMKPIMVANIVLDDVEYRNCFIDFKVRGSTYEGAAFFPDGSDVKIRIRDDDVVEVTLE